MLGQSPNDAAARAEHNLIPTLITLLAASAALFVIGLILLQSDAVSRLLLPPSRLRAKRRSEQIYRFQHALDVRLAEIRSFVDGTGGSAFRYDPKDWETDIDLLTREEEFDELAARIVADDDGEGSETPVVVGIDRDPLDERARREWYLYLAFPPPPTSTPTAPQDEGGPMPAGGVKKWRRVQVPFVPLTQKLADRFEETKTSTSLCFVADASGGLGSELIGRVAGGCGAGVAVIREPFWMSALASLVQSDAMPTSDMERAVFVLCRMDARRVRDDVVGDRRTVAFVLPGQSCSPTLVPLLRKAFPRERHIFAYDSCVESVRRGVALRKKKKGGGRTETSRLLSDVYAMPRSVTAVVPLSPLRAAGEIADALAALPGDRADAIEAWMASVDSMLSMKKKADEIGGSNDDDGYLPFVCHLGFLMGRTKRSGNGGNVDAGELALMNVLQYVTGTTQSHPPMEGVVDAAREVLRSAREECASLVDGIRLGDAEVKAIEECAFKYKGILVQDEVLLDTVWPQKEWSLRATYDKSQQQPREQIQKTSVACKLTN